MMEEDDKLRLQANRPFLVEHIKIQDIQDRLVSEFILSAEDEENVSRVNSFEAVRLLINLLIKCPEPRAYNVFCHALNEKGYEFVVQQLDSTDIYRVKEKARLDRKHQEDQIEKLQKQVWMQCEMMMDMRKDLDRLKSQESTTKMHEQKYSNIMSLENKMKEQGISSDDLIDLLVKFMKSGGFSENSEEEIVVDNLSEVADSIPEEILPNQSHIASIAREIGKDIAFYMVMKRNRMDPVPPPNKYAEVFRKLVDELNERYEDVFMDLVAKVNLDETTGFQAFVNIANEIFSDETNNWGRVVVTYTYIGWVAVNMYSENDKKTWERICTLGDFLGYFIAQKVGGWIEDQGGWEQFLTWFAKPKDSAEKSYWRTVMLGSLGLGVAIGISYLKN